MTELAWGATVGGWALSASLDKASFQAEEPVLVSLVLKNVSDGPLSYGTQNSDFDYVLECKNAQQEVVPLTLFGQRMQENRGRGRYVSKALLPQGQVVHEISATRHLDLSLPGKYTLIVTREISPGENDGQRLVSNPCVFEIAL